MDYAIVHDFLLYSFINFPNFYNDKRLLKKFLKVFLKKSENVLQTYDKSLVSCGWPDVKGESSLKAS